MELIITIITIIGIYCAAKKLVASKKQKPPTPSITISLNQDQKNINLEAEKIKWKELNLVFKHEEKNQLKNSLQILSDPKI